MSDFLRRTAYITAYDRRNRIPAWTAEHLTAASLKKPKSDASNGEGSGGDRQNSTFREDESVPAMFRAHLLDYFRSGYGTCFRLVATWSEELTRALGGATRSRAHGSRGGCETVADRNGRDVLAHQYRTSSRRRYIQPLAALRRRPTDSLTSQALTDTVRPSSTASEPNECPSLNLFSRRLGLR